jgi:plasmid stabilization system protein ParE
MRLVWAEQAETDLYEIADHYASISPGLDDELLARIFGAPLVLLDYPLLGESIGMLDLHKWAVRRTPFILLYRVTATNIEVARVVHAASDWERE